MVLGLITLVMTFVCAIGAGGWLWTTATRPYTWQRKIRSPKVVDEPYYPTDASVGYV